MLRALIEHGVDLGAIAKNPQSTVLHMAASNNNAGAILMLVEAGPNIEARTTPLLHACYASTDHEALFCCFAF